MHRLKASKLLSQFPPISVDFREKNSELFSLLTSTPMPMEQTILSTGDYLIDHSILIERKSARDFIASIMDGRLFLQAKKLKVSGFRSLFLIEGSPLNIQSRMHPSAIKGALATLAGAWQIPYYISDSVYDSLEFMLLLHKQNKLKQPLIARNQYKPKRLHNRKVYFLQGLPSVGAKSAQLLLSHIQNLRSIINASSEEMLKVPSFGSKKVKNIQSFLIN